MVKGIRVGLTGGIGSGKSTVAGFFAQRGACVIDADALSRASTAAGGAAIPAIARAFGPEVIGPDGALNRTRMRDIAFQDAAARQQLQSIIHPLVGLAIAQAAAEADSRHIPCVVYDIPLLVESGHWRRTLDTVLVIDCQEATQIHRVGERSGLSETEVLAVLSAQASRQQRLYAADHVIFNDGISLPQLERLAGQFATEFGL
jgi:dephospho-CoA kinase